jgi:hypothetical protein
MSLNSSQYIGKEYNDIYLHLYLMISETPHPIIQKLSILACCLYLYTADIVLSVSMHTLNNILRDYYMIFFIPALVSARDSHIKSDSEAGGLISGTIWKISWHNLFITYFTLTFFKYLLLYCRKDFLKWQIAKINSLREFSLFNLQIFLLRVWFQKDIKQCRYV